MKGEDFLNSEYCEKAKDLGVQEQIKNDYNPWLKRCGKYAGKLTGMAEQLFEYFTSSNFDTASKVVVGGALLYIITPFDLIPDALPIVGWLDDIGVAGFALNYVKTAINELEIEKEKELEIIRQKEIEAVNAAIKKKNTIIAIFISALLVVVITCAFVFMR